jgi:hypothetical protein
MASHLAITEGGALSAGGVTLNTQARVLQSRENNAPREEALIETRDARPGARS